MIKDEFKLVHNIVGDKIVHPNSVLRAATFQNFEKVIVVGDWKKKEGLYLASSHNVHETISMLEAALTDLKSRL